MSSSESTCIWSCCQPITHLHLHPEIFTALSCLHSCLCIPDLGMKMKMILKRPLKGSIDANLENRLAPSNARSMGRRVIKVKVLKVKAPKGKAPSTKVPKVKLGLRPIVQLAINKVCHFYKPGSTFLAT